jgi:hypothetical protein
MSQAVLAMKASFNHLKTFVNQQLKDEAVGTAGAKAPIIIVGWRPYTGRHVSPLDRSIVKWLEV